jgi:predicted metal-dependent hydrolase
MPPHRILRESGEFELANGERVALERVHDPRARHLRLVVNERGVRLTVPRWAGLTDAQAFLQRHRDWLQAQLERRGPSPARADFAPGSSARLPLRGEEIDLHWREGRFARLQHDADALVLQLPPSAPPAQARRLLRDFYLAEARADVGRWLPQHLPGLPRAPSLLRIRPLRSLWGSLSASGALSLDLALVLGRPQAFEYVLVHELCHLIQPNHSRTFWCEVEARFPHWRGERDYLRGEGLDLKRRLAGLLQEPAD